MNHIQKELLSSINKTERFSGMDSFDSAEGEGFYGADDFAYAEDFGYAGGAPVASETSLPYVVQYVNAATANVTATLLGYNLYGGSGITNFGNASTTTISNLQGNGQTYQSLLLQSATQGFKIKKWRFQSDTASQLVVTFSLTYVNANGVQQTTPLNLTVEKDAYQQQSNIIDVSRVWLVDGNSYATFTLIASATLTIAMYPESVISPKMKLAQGQSMRAFKVPNLSRGNQSPVIIQTTQGVQGVR